jgi:hypothetical protein
MLMPLGPHATIDPVLSTTLKLGSGLFWTITYILIIRRGLIDKRYGMPMVALCANISWEFIFSFIFPHRPPQLYIDYAWLFFDLGILIQFLLYGKKDFPKNLSSDFFLPSFILTLIMAFLAVLFISMEYEDYHGVYAAFGQNFMMSVLFVFLLLKRESSEGQSIYIAICKMIGTIPPSTLFHLYYPDSYLLNFLYIAILTFDLVYLFLLYRTITFEKINPWKRV